MGENGTRGTYHTLVSPVKTLNAIVLRIPAKFGTTLPLADFPSCGHLGIIGVNYFDFIVTTQIIPNLPGVNPSNLPIFLLYNTVMSPPVTDLNTCCILGYHGTTGFPIQTYSPGEFDTAGLFGPTVSDTSIFAHMKSMNGWTIPSATTRHRCGAELDRSLDTARVIWRLATHCRAPTLLPSSCRMALLTTRRNWRSSRGSLGRLRWGFTAGSQITERF